MSAGGFSKARLARGRAIMAGHVERGDVPGLVTLVSRRGETHVEALGTMAFGGETAVQRDTIFRIASMTKPVAAAAALILVEECRLRLDDPVDDLLPELADRQVLKRIDGPLDETVPAERPITVRDLLTFTWGTGQVFEPSPIQQALVEQKLGAGPPEPQAAPDPDEWIRRVGALPLMYQPGERWMYNTGSDVLGVLIARASGQPFESFLRERLFEPLGMHDTGFHVPEGKLDRLPTSYWTNFETGALEVYDEPSGQWSTSPAFPSGAGGLVSTADDYLAFGQLLLNGGRYGNERILSRPSVELMTADHLTSAQKAVSGFFPDDFTNDSWGFGVGIVTRRTGHASVGSYGWAGGLGTVWDNDPAEDLIGIVLTQRMFSSPRLPAYCRDFWTTAYQAIDD
jgi:CubicO group peptidase (beta-lactamase class C family)